ncbi:unnamed protein product, partial [marine sediment metagenome]
IALYDMDDPGNDFLSFEMSGMLQVEESFEPNVDFITFDHRHYFWKIPNPTPPPDFNSSRVLQGSESGYPFRQIALTRKVCGYSELISGISSWETKIHDKEYTSEILGFTFAENTLQFTDPKVTFGFYNYDYNWPTFCIEATLIWQPQGWNKFPKLNTDGDPTTPKAKIDFLEMQVQWDMADNDKIDYEPFEAVDMTEFIFSSTTAGQGGIKKFNPDIIQCPGQ